MMLFLLGTGCRLSGLRLLRFQDLDLDGRRANVVEKGNKRRWVYLDNVAINALLDYIHHQRPLTDSPYVFVSKAGNGPLASTVIRWNLDKIADAAGVTGPHNPHAFRHAFSIMMLQSGANLAAVSRLLGHSDVTITGRYYARFEASTLQEIHGEHNPLVLLSLPRKEIR
jgi:site-specific recombinase XerD